jgi:hypothetical protein
MKDQIDYLIETRDVEIAKNKTIVECMEKETDSILAETALQKTENNVRNGRDRFTA